MSDLYTVQVINNSGAAGKVYSLFSAKSVIEGGGNTADTTKSIVLSRSRKLPAGGEAVFRFDNTFYGFMGSTSGSQLSNGSIIDSQTYKLVTVGTSTLSGSVLQLNKDSDLVAADDDDDNPPYNDVISVARGKSLGAGITPGPINCVQLKAGVTYTFTVDKAVYVKADDLIEKSIQTAPAPDDKKAIKVVFPARMKKATVVEDSKGGFTVDYSPA
ncbi:hypothetical protein EG329_000989 [Mollisiaceae sp. DMI_Dod_QoI]|nr:hypothetical protein EG329_000989 [Helotiales sp. DMI_Dod_QoI]